MTKLKEASMPQSTVPSIMDVITGLQKLMDYLPAKAREDLEGDGDGDGDPNNVTLAGMISQPQTAENGVTEALREARDAISFLLLERQFTADERKALAAKGHALPDGSYPITDAQTLNDAKQAFGRNPTPAVKAHINKRAKDLGQPPMGEEKQKQKESADPLSEADGACAVGDEAFGAMGPSQQKNHLTSAHGVAADHADLQVPSKRVALHQAQKESFWTGSIDEEFEPLIESGINSDGLKEIKIIAPGWGTSGYYSPKVLERDGPLAFPKGTKQFWDHPLSTEEASRPERSLRDLAAEIATTPKYIENHAKGPGLYAMTKPFSKYRESINELAPHIGVSIRAMGRGSIGEAEGRRGKIIEEIKKGQSIDFVTVPGAGGQILESFREAGTFENSATAEEDAVDNQKLQEAEARLKERDDQIAELRLQLRGDDARKYVTEQLGKFTEGMKPASIAKLTEALAAKPVLDDDGEINKSEFTKTIKEAVNAERAYLLEVAGETGRVQGIGSSAGSDLFSESGAKPQDMDKLRESREQSFLDLGLSPEVAKQAALGRK